MNKFKEDEKNSHQKKCKLINLPIWINEEKIYERFSICQGHITITSLFRSPCINIFGL